MVWERDEDGLTVIVTLSRIEEMPMSPADRIPGQWDLVSATRGTSDVTEEYDPYDRHRIDVRRGQTYKLVHSDSTESFGYWRMDSHSPEFHLIDFNRNVDFQVYAVSLTPNRLTMKSKTDTDMTFVYRRLY